MCYLPVPDVENDCTMPMLTNVLMADSQPIAKLAMLMKQSLKNGNKNQLMKLKKELTITIT